MLAEGYKIWETRVILASVIKKAVPVKRNFNVAKGEAVTKKEQAP